MAIENTYLLGKNITLGCGFDLQAKAPLDSRMTVATYEGLAALVNGNAAYEGMRVFVETGAEKGNYQYLNGEWKNELAELKTLIESTATAAMEFKGAATALPENPARGDMYKVTAAFKVGEEDVKVGDSIVYDGEQWVIIPSGDDIEDTWRPVTDVDNDSALTFAAGNKLDVAVTANGTITYSHEEIDAPTNMNEEGDEQTRTYITQLITDNHGHVIGFKTATENVEDTNTTYEFEGQSDEATSVYFQVKSSDAEAAEVVYLNAYSKNEADEALANAVAEVKTEAANQDAVVLAEAQAYADGKDAAIEAAQKAADDITAYVGTFTHDTAKTVVEYVNAKTDGIATSGNLEALGQRVTANEGKIADLETESAKHALKTELEAVDAKFADYKTAEAQKAIDDEQDRRLGVIEGDYLKAADIADFETKENVKKVADDLAAYVESNDAALAAETKARSEADAGFETRIANLEANFGDGEGTVEAQIAAAVAAEAEIARAAEKANADDIDALEGRMDTAEGKITALETESAKHATKDELADVDAKFADYVTSASYATDKQGVDAAIADRYTKEEADGKFALITDAYDDTALSNRVKTIEDDYLKGADKTELAGLVTAEKERAQGIEGGLRTDVNNIKADYLKASDKTELSGFVTAEKERAEGIEAGLRTDVDAIKSDYLKTADKTALQEQITANANAITTLTNGIDPDKIDGLTDLVNWANEHAPEVESIKNDIEANAKAISDESARADAAEKALAGRLDTLEAIDHEAYVGADAALKAELSATIEEAKATATNQDAVVLAESQKYADASKAEAEAKAAELDAALKSELQGEIDADVKVVNDALEGYKTSNDAAVALKANVADVYGKSETFTQDEVNAAIEAAVTAAMQWAEF